MQEVGIKYSVHTVLPLTFLSYRSPLLLFSPIYFMSSLILWIFHSWFFLSLAHSSFHSFLSFLFLMQVFVLFLSLFFLDSSFLSLLPRSVLPCFIPLLLSFSVSIHFRISFFLIFFCQQAKQVTVVSRDSQLK